MQTNIWTPLQMQSTTFRPWKRPDLEAKLVQAAIRTPAVTAGGSGNLIKGKVPFGYPAPDCCGGAGLYSTPADQTKLLSALLEGGNNKILSAASLDELLRPQLTAIGTMSHSHFLTEVNGPPKTHVGNIMWPQGSKGAGFGLGASINAEGFSGRRASGSANWQGMPGINAVSFVFPCSCVSCVSRVPVPFSRLNASFLFSLLVLVLCVLFFGLGITTLGTCH